MKQEDAFAIDEVSLYERLGLEPFKKLSTEFYTRYVCDASSLLAWFFLVTNSPPQLFVIFVQLMVENEIDAEWKD